MPRPARVNSAPTRFGFCARCWSLLLTIFFMASLGCASDPVSQARIQQRNARVDRTVTKIKQSEARRPAKFDDTMKDISRDQERKKAQFRETMRTLGDRFW